MEAPEMDHAIAASFFIPIISEPESQSRPAVVTSTALRDEITRAGIAHPLMPRERRTLANRP